MNPPLVALKHVDFFERPARLRLPFKFGAVTITHAQQAFVRAVVEVDGEPTTGMAAELLAAKWFDKNRCLSNEENYEQLRQSLRIAARLYIGAGEAVPAFALHAALLPLQYRACALGDLNGLIASYGSALIDRAILDALCRRKRISVFDAVRANLPGITAHTTPDLYAEDLDAFLATRQMPQTIAARHTVGMADAISQADVAEPLDDGLPESLEAVIAAYGHRHFKLKVGGDAVADTARLAAIAAVLDTIDAPYMVSLDGNEQFADADAVMTLIEAIRSEPRLSRLWASTAYLEQPIARHRAADAPVHIIAAHVPVAVDESDAHIGIFPVFRALGYSGISAKSGKGLYRGLLNAARAASWNRQAGDERYFMIAEDLTTQPGISVQQDFALAALVGADNVERNGHHYVDGFAGASDDEARRFRAAHPELYSEAGGRIRLAISDGQVSLASLGVPGLAVDTEPDWQAMAPMPAPTRAR